MFIAIDSNNNKVTIKDANKQEQYFCPTCGAPLSIRAESSTLKAKHFAHKRGTYCTDDWKYEMSAWHLAWQEQFPVDCREVVMERDGEKHRADICIPNSIIIEFQHSPISHEEFTKRNLFYLKCGYKILWIFDAEKKIKTPVEDIIVLDPNHIRWSDGDADGRPFEWTRRQDTFKTCGQAYPQNDSVAVFLETKCESIEDKILIPLSIADPIFPRAYFCYPYMTTKSVLKEYGGLDDPAIPSVREIVENSRNIQQHIRSQVKIRSKRRW